MSNGAQRGRRLVVVGFLGLLVALVMSAMAAAPGGASASSIESALHMEPTAAHSMTGMAAQVASACFDDPSDDGACSATCHPTATFPAPMLPPGPAPLAAAPAPERRAVAEATPSIPIRPPRAG